MWVWCSVVRWKLEEHKQINRWINKRGKECW